MPFANLVFHKLDLANLKSVREFVNELNETHIDILINNAGVFFPKYCTTDDGFEMHFGTNHLGHFLLTILLLPKLNNAKQARIVNVSSLGHLCKY